MSEWKPIETAPKDGTRVWLWNGYRRSIGWYGHYDDGYGWNRQSLLLGEYFDGVKDIAPDTHWHPLPEPPT